MALPTVASVGAYANATGNMTITLGSHQPDDILLALVETDDEAVSCSTTGWAEITGALCIRAGGTRLTWFWKRATSSSETNPVITGTTNHKGGFPIALRGCYQRGNPWDVIGPENDGLTDTTTTTGVKIPTVTTTKIDCLVLIGVAGGNDSAAAQFSGPASPNLANLTTQKNEGTTTGNGGGILLCTGELATPGATGEFTATHSGDDNWAGIHVAFRPPEPFTPQAIWQR